MFIINAHHVVVHLIPMFQMIPIRCVYIGSKTIEMFLSNIKFLN